MHGALLLILLCHNITEEQVTSGEIEVKVKYVATTVVNQKSDLCESVKKNGLSCPLSAGEQTMTISQTIPGYAPLVSVPLEGEGARDGES